MALSHILNQSSTTHKIGIMDPIMNPYENTNCSDHNDQESEQRCFSCQSSALVTDWKQGDIICTNCGIVNEDRIRDTRQEWTDFNDVADIVKDLPSNARCGMIPTDESRYVGGLQPTTLSKYPFGGTCSDIPTKYNNNIRRNNIRIEKMLEKENAKQVEAAELARRILIKRRKEKKKQKEDMLVKSFDSEAEHQQKVISEEEKELEELASSLPPQSSLLTNKWSLERAILMNGSDEEASSVLFKSVSTTSMEYNRDKLIEIEKKALLSRMEISERIASRDLYHAYTTLSKNIAVMKLPMSILTECTNFICQYVTKRNGFHVKGIASREKSLEKDKTFKSQSYETRKKRKIQEDLLKQVNKEKQMMGLISAVIFIEAKKIGLGRSLKDICLNFDPHLCCQAHLMKNNVKVSSDQSTKKLSTILKPKFVSKAVAELKVEFPQFFQSLTNPSVSAANLVHHVGEKLNLPSAAIGSIRALALFCGKEQMEKGIGAGCKPGVLCAAVTYLICRAAKVMQRLAKQALFAAEMGKQNEDQDIFDKKRKKDLQKETKMDKNEMVKDSKCKERKRQSKVKEEVSFKKRKLENSDVKVSKDDGKASSLPEPILSNTDNQILDDDISCSNIDTSYDDLKIHPGIVSSMDPDDETEMAKFDALSNDQIDTESDDKELEALQGWFSWSNQSPWSRELSDIAKACDVTYTGVLEYYKLYLHPRRASLLPVVQEYLKTCQDADVCYLVNISAAVPLMILGQS